MEDTLNIIQKLVEEFEDTLVFAEECSENNEAFLRGLDGASTNVEINNKTITILIQVEE